MNNFTTKPVNFITSLLFITLFASESFCFGQNKVQFSLLNWWMLQSKHYTLYYHQKMNNLPAIANKWVDNSYRSLSGNLNFSHNPPIPLIIYGSPSLFAQTNIISENLPEGVGGFTEVFKTRVVVPFTGSYDELRHVLHHELVHAFVFGIVFDKFGGGSAMLSNAQIPFWFNEGGAEYLSSGWDCEADMFMMEQTLNSSIPIPGPQLDGYMAYKGGQSFLHFLQKSRGDSAFSQFLLEFRKTKMVDNSINKIYKQTTEELGKEWIKELRRLYWPEIGQREDPSEKCTFITSHAESRDQFNLRPRISPDGKKIAFFSDRRDYTRIIITDRKGKVEHEISQSGYGGFFESFHPFRSGMCWSPDGTKLAFVTLNKGKDEIRVIDINKKRLLEKIQLQLSGISSPDWSRDGRYLVFSAISDGYGDLYTYDFQSDSLSRLTESIEYEADPHFSPDGVNVVFSLEDTTGSAEHPHSPYGSVPTDLAFVELSTRKLTKITNTAWNEKQPCFSSDGKKLLYVSDRNGLDNLYIQSLDSTEKSKPLTDFIGGCSNPDWSIDGNNVVFTLFQNQGWDVLCIDQPIEKLKQDSLTNTRWVSSWLDTSETFFKKVQIKSKDTSEIKEPGRPNRRKQELNSKKTAQNLNSDNNNVSTKSDSVIRSDSSAQKISTQIKNDEFKIDSIAKDTSTVLSNHPIPYRLKFTSDMVAFGLGMSNYYSPAGQVLLSFSDLMGDHKISAAADIQGNFKDYMHVFASYLYLRHRIDLGVGAFFNKDYSYADIFGDRLYHDQESGGFLIASYPFSIFSRLDFQLFYRDVLRKPEESGDPEIKSTSLLPSLTFSFDNILWGITGPLNGVRVSSRLLLSPPLDFVDDHFISFDTDLRAYLHLFKRFVWANRIYAGVSKSLEKGSSGRRYFLGGNENWFSYSINRENYDKNLQNTFYSEFVTPFRGFNYLDLTGSRVAVFNSEFRFPFIREISIAWPLPIQIRYINGALFTDLGNAWDAEDSYHGLPLPDKLYGGFGFGLRANLGMFILRFDRGWPTDWRNEVWKPINYFSLGAEY